MVFCTHHDGQTVLNATLTCLCHLLYSIIEANKAEWNFQLLSIGPVHFRFKVSLVVFIICFQFFIDHSISSLQRLICLYSTKTTQYVYGLIVTGDFPLGHSSYCHEIEFCRPVFHTRSSNPTKTISNSASTRSGR